MKIHILSADETGKIDGTNQRQLFDFLPTTPSTLDCDCVLVPVSYFPDFKFNPALYAIKKPVILVDYVEFCWDAGERENRFSTGMTKDFPHLNSDEWTQFEDWLNDHPPTLTFKRELQKRHCYPGMIPIEYLCYLPIPPIQSKAEFDARPFDWFNVFGYSHPDRVRLHGETFIAMGSRGLNVISDWSQFENLPQPIPPKSVISIYSPWWVRQPMSVVIKWQQQAKISVSMFGAGKKSFRDAEAPVGAILARPEDNLAWSYPWTAVNSVVLDDREELNSLIEANLWNLIDIYEKYVACQENLRNYECQAYVNNYVMPAIERVL